MELRLSELLQCMYIAALERRNPNDSENSAIEIATSFKWNGKKGKLTFVDDYNKYYSSYGRYTSFYCKMEIGSKIIVFPLMNLQYKYRFRIPVDVTMDQEGMSDGDDYSFSLAVYLMLTGVFTAEEIKNKIMFTEPPEGKTSVKVSNKDGHLSKIIINVNFEEDDWADQLQRIVMRNNAPMAEVYEIAKHLDSLFEFLNSSKLEVNTHDCYDLLPRDLYLIDDYTFEEYISSGDYLTITDPIEKTDLGQAEKERQNAIDRIDKESKFQPLKKEGEVSAKELLASFKNETLTYIENELLEENEDVREKLESLADEFDETTDDIIPHLFKDFWDEVEKCLQKDLKKFPYQEEPNSYLSKKITDYLDYLKDHAKRLKVYIEDLEDAILELDIDDIVE